MDAREIESKIQDIDDALKTYDEVLKKATKLKKERALLKKQLDEIVDEHLSFEGQFDKWLSRSTGHHSTWIPEEENFPALRQLIQNNDFNRRETINVRDNWEWQYVTNEKEAKDAIKKGWTTQREIDLLREAAKEVLKHNLKSFKFDW